MIRIPSQELSQLRKRLHEWESWVGSLLRLSSAHSELYVPLVEVNIGEQLHDTLRRVQESIGDLQQRLHKAHELFEECDVTIDRSVGQVFEQFSSCFDTHCLESLHLCAVENDVHRLSLNGAISATVVPGVRTLDLLPKGLLL